MPSETASILPDPLKPTVPAQSQGRDLLLGIVFIVVAFFCVAVMSAFGKAASQVPTGPLVFFQNGISLLLFLPFVLRGGRAEIVTKRLPLHIVRALAGLLSQALFFIAVKSIALVDAVLLANAAPLFIPLVALIWMRTPIRVPVVLSLLGGFLGVILILKPSADLLRDPAALIALSAASFSAVALVSVNRLSTTEKSDTILFYYFLISTLATLPFAYGQWQTPYGLEWLYLFGVGFFMALSQLFIILAYRHATAAQIAPFNYSVVVFSGLIGWIVWDNALDWISFVGIVLVCAGGICSILLSAPAQKHAFVLSHGHNAQKTPKLSS
jgi:drug/metabolite transporter (DMT)-like permease